MLLCQKTSKSGQIGSFAFIFWRKKNRESEIVNVTSSRQTPQICRGASQDPSKQQAKHVTFIKFLHSFSQFLQNTNYIFASVN